ncbi:putative efflux protein, MATE family [Eubacterium aggregans]|uniref:Multidrug export protein MepA n=1 Tax=Eubacterium aggregans TaxID=81409 RepID=A0A1H4CQK0_9FIRM|nr:MATE family efflux transporter [Eubacterium aggregans]SEA62673.1 putative efflux protein, MATE family [Eubacterium aggregans]
MVKSHCFRDFVKYSSLNVLGMIGLSCYILADTFFVSKGLGTNGLAALNLAIPIYSFIHGCGLMIGIGGGTKYAIKKNQGDQDTTNRIFTHGIYLAILFSVFFVFIGLFFSAQIVTLFGANEGVFAMTKTYTQVILLFSPAFLMNNVLLCFVRNDGAPQLAMAAMIGGSLSNILLDYVFIFPFHMGIFGAVFATGLAPIISMVILSPHFIKKRNHFHFAKCQWNGITLGGILSSGAPSLITELSSGIVIIVLNTIILSLQGNTGVAAYGVIANLSLVVIAIYTGIAQGIQPILSSHFGAKNTKNVRSILKYALTTMVILSGIIYTAVFFGAPAIAAVFNNEHNPLLQAIAIHGLRLYFIACPFVGFNIILSVYFTSTEYPRPAHIISLLRGFILIIPMAFILSRVAGMTGVWCAFPATEWMVAMVGIVFYVLRYGSSKPSL